MVASSTFNQADSTTVGPGSFTEVAGDWATVSNQLKLSTVGTTSRIRFESDTGSSDMYCQAIIPDLILSSDVFVAVCARFDAATSTFYYFGHGKTGGFPSGYFLLGKMEAGVTSVLVSFTAFAHSVNETIRIETQGSTIRGYIGGALKTSATDTSISAGTRGGVRGYRDASGDDFTIDNLEVGLLSVPYSRQPSHRPAPFAPGGPPAPQFARRI